MIEPVACGMPGDDPQAIDHAGTLASLIALARAAGRVEGRLAERADAVAFMARRAINAGRIASSSAAAPGDRELAADRQRQAEAAARDLRAGMHEGLAGIDAPGLARGRHLIDS